MTTWLKITLVGLLVVALSIAGLILYLQKSADGGFKLQFGNQVEDGTVSILLGKVLSWDSTTRNLSLTYERQGYDSTILVDLSSVTMVTYSENINGVVDQIPVFNESNINFVSGFCVGDSVRVEFERHGDGNVLTSVVNNGPRKCR